MDLICYTEHLQYRLKSANLECHQLIPIFIADVAINNRLMVEKDSGYDYIMNHPEETGKHMGKWMLIYDNKIVAADDDLLKIYEQFEKDYPNKIPFVVKFPKAKGMLL